MSSEFPAMIARRATLAVIMLCVIQAGASADTTSKLAVEQERSAQQARRVTGGRSMLAYVDIERFLDSLEADRLLVAEIRKQVPEARGEADVFLARLKDLASRSDPVRLVPLVNRVLSNAPMYYDWLDSEFDSEEERIIEYYIGGARGFHFALETFKSSVLLTVINRLDIAGRVIRETALGFTE